MTIETLVKDLDAEHGSIFLVQPKEDLDASSRDAMFQQGADFTRRYFDETGRRIYFLIVPAGLTVTNLTQIAGKEGHLVGWYAAEAHPEGASDDR